MNSNSSNRNTIKITTAACCVDRNLHSMSIDRKKDSLYVIQMTCVLLSSSKIPVQGLLGIFSISPEVQVTFPLHAFHFYHYTSQFRNALQVFAALLRRPHKVHYLQAEKKRLDIFTACTPTKRVWKILLKTRNRQRSNKEEKEKIPDRSEVDSHDKPWCLRSYSSPETPGGKQDTGRKKEALSEPGRQKWQRQNS